MRLSKEHVIEQCQIYFKGFQRALRPTPYVEEQLREEKLKLYGKPLFNKGDIAKIIDGSFASLEDDGIENIIFIERPILLEERKHLHDKGIFGDIAYNGSIFLVEHKKAKVEYKTTPGSILESSLQKY